MQLLLVEDETRTARQLVVELGRWGHDVTVAADGRSALAQATARPFDGIILDVMLPLVDGLTVARSLRDLQVDLPILMLSALGSLDDRLAGLDAGADDYLVKPAAAAEIDARLRAIVRRAARAGDTGILRAGDLEVNEVRHRVVRSGREIVLQNKDFQMLVALVRQANSVVTRQQLYRQVWGLAAAPATNLVESSIRRLRARLNAPGETDPIVTIRGVGYMLADHA